MQPHIKILKLPVATDSAIEFIKVHKKDNLFIHLLSVALNPANSYPTLNIVVSLKAVPTVPTETTISGFNRFISSINDLDTEKATVAAESYLATLDAPTASAYSTILNRDVPISYPELLTITTDYSKLSLTEHTVPRGFLPYPFIYLPIRTHGVRLNVYNYLNDVTVRTADGQPYELSEVTRTELLAGLRLGEWCTGFYDSATGLFSVLDIYTDSTLPATERLKIRDRRFLLTTQVYLPAWTVVESNEAFIECFTGFGIIRRESKAAFGKQHSEIVDVSYLANMPIKALG